MIFGSPNSERQFIFFHAFIAMAPYNRPVMSKVERAASISQGMHISGRS